MIEASGGVGQSAQSRAGVPERRLRDDCTRCHVPGTVTSPKRERIVRVAVSMALLVLSSGASSSLGAGADPKAAPPTPRADLYVGAVEEVADAIRVIQRRRAATGAVAFLFDPGRAIRGDEAQRPPSDAAFAEMECWSEAIESLPGRKYVAWVGAQSERCDEVTTAATAQSVLRATALVDDRVTAAEWIARSLTAVADDRDCTVILVALRADNSAFHAARSGVSVKLDPESTGAALCVRSSDVWLIAPEEPFGSRERASALPVVPWASRPVARVSLAARTVTVQPRGAIENVSVKDDFVGRFECDTTRAFRVSAQGFNRTTDYPSGYATWMLARTTALARGHILLYSGGSAKPSVRWLDPVEFDEGLWRGLAPEVGRVEDAIRGVEQSRWAVLMAAATREAEYGVAWKGDSAGGDRIGRSRWAARIESLCGIDADDAIDEDLDCGPKGISDTIKSLLRGASRIEAQVTREGAMTLDANARDAALLWFQLEQSAFRLTALREALALGESHNSKDTRLAMAAYDCVRMSDLLSDYVPSEPMPLEYAPSGLRERLMALRGPWCTIRPVGFESSWYRSRQADGAIRARLPASLQVALDRCVRAARRVVAGGPHDPWSGTVLYSTLTAFEPCSARNLGTESGRRLNMSSVPVVTGGPPGSKIGSTRTGR